MAWCLTAPSHYMKQCWLMNKCVHWHLPESSYPKRAHEHPWTYLTNFQITLLKLDESTARRQLKSPRSLSGRSIHLTLVIKWSCSWSWMTYCHPLCLCTMSIGPPILRYSYFMFDLQHSKVKVMVKVKPTGHIWALGVQSICLLFVSWQSDHFRLRYRKFHICPWKFKVKVMAKVKPTGHIWALGVQSMCLHFVSWQSDHFWLRYKQIPYLTLKNLGQGHDENQPKSNQVIYRSGPTIVPKMKEIQKVVQKLLREQESAAGASAGGVWTGTKTLIHPRYTGVT